MSISSIQTPASPQVSWSTINAQEKDADFLTLRLLNKRTRVRISPQPLDVNVHDGKGTYFVASNTKGWFAAIARNTAGRYQLSFSPLSDLRKSIVSSKTEGEDDFIPKHVVSVAGAPVHLTLALNDERLVVGLSDGSLSVYDTSSLFSSGVDSIEPLRTFPPSPPGPLRQIIGNPGDLPELVAVRRDASSGADGLAVEILNVKQLQSAGGWRTGGIPGSVPTSIVWSAKGKQLAIGLKGGSIVTYSPADMNIIKLHVPKPPCVGDSSVISMLWLSNQAFYGIYAPVNDMSPEAPQKHVLTLFDSKTDSAMQTELETPYYASPALRPPGAFTVVMRNWSPAKFLIFIGDSTSSDIGLVGCVCENDNSDTWCNLALEETSTPSVPLDKDAEDTVPLALDLDFTVGQSDQAASASPILYLYASDGTLQAWFVSNEKGGTYPGMVILSPIITSSAAQPIQSAVKHPVAPAPTAFGSTRSEVTSPVFGQTSVSPSSQPQQTSSGFGSSGFGQQAPAPAAFGQATGSSAFGQSPGGGFGAFASSGPSKFGSTGFGFGNAPLPALEPSSAPAQTTETDAASPEAEMSEADANEADKLGGLSLGGTGNTSKSQDKSANSIFGSFAQPPGQDQPLASSFSGTGTTSSFGAFGSIQGSGFLKPASGFGAFLKPTESPSTTIEASSDKQSQPSSAFGAPGFGTSGFGATKPQSGFGQPAFGQSSFGTPTTFGKSTDFGSPSSVSVGTASGGFSAFAGAMKAFSSFAEGGASGLAQQAQSLQSKLSEAPSIAMASSSEDTEKLSSPIVASEEKLSPRASASQNAVVESSLSPLGIGAPILPSGTSQALSPDTKDGRQSTFSTPTARAQSPASSPEETPKQERKLKPEALVEDSFSDAGDQTISTPDQSLQSTTPLGTPAPSIFKTTGPVPTGGAFGNLTTTPSAFKPAQGFGAFGASTKTPSSSPFANPKPVSISAFSTPVKPVSAFGAGGSGPSVASSTSPADSTTPKFGTPSTPGVSSVFGKSSFGTPATPSPISTTPLTTPKGNAFSAYSGSGGFSAFANAGKTSSFSDLLKSQKDEEASTSTLSKTPESSNERKEEEASFVSVSKQDELDQDNLPPTPSTHGTFDEEEQDLGDEQEQDEAGSFLSESFSEEAGEEPEEEEGEEEEEEREEEEEEEEELEEVVIEAKGEGSEEPVHAVESTSRSRAPSPATVPLPSSRESTPAPVPGDEEKKPVSQVDSSREPGKRFSDASTKNAAVPPKSPSPSLAKPSLSGIPTLFEKPKGSPGGASAGTTKLASPSPPPSLFGKQAASTSESTAKPPSQSVFSKSVSTVRSESATPPGSPSKQEDEQPLPAPKAMGPSASSSVSLGLGWPGSRPARSSPLAGAPLSAEESKNGPNNQTTQLAPLLRKARPASPKAPFGQVSSSEVKPGSPSFAKPGAMHPQTAQRALKPPVFGVGQASPAADNAPFIMPQATPAALSGKPGSIGRLVSQAADASVRPPQLAGQPSMQMTLESGLQRECLNIWNSMLAEADFLAKHAGTVVRARTNVTRATPASHTRDDLRNKDLWSFRDLTAFTNVVEGLEKDVLAAVRLKDEFVPLLRDLESSLLKAETRKEEVIRFSKARADPEFAKMLKSRTLGPDVAETRSQLRRQIRLINDRVEQLEAHLKSCKKKLEEYQKGKSSIKPPSLDTVNRIYRNIDLAIESQTEQIEALTSRIAKLDVEDLDVALHGTSSTRRKSASKGVVASSESDSHEDGEEDALVPSHVTPSIAASTAAALNAERNALRLKNALLAVRKTPLLNTQAAEAARYVPPPESDFPSFDLSLDVWRTPELDAAAGGQRRPNRHASHGKSVKLGKSNAQVPESIASFDWGPLPKPMSTLSTLPFDLRPAS